MNTRLLPGVRGLLTLVPVCLLSLACGAHAPAPQPGPPRPTPRPNLLRNADLLDGTGSWRAGADGAVLTYDQAGFVTASAVEGTAPVSGAWSQTVPVSPGAAYYASYRARSDGLVGWADMTLSFRDEAGRPLFEIGVLPVTGDTAWATYAWRCRAPAGAAQATVSLGVERATAGQAAFDEACLAPDDAPTVRALIVDNGQEVGSLRALPGLNGGAQPALARLRPARVRVAGLGALFPDPRADPESPASYDFQAADATLAAAAAGGAEVLLQLDEAAAPGASAGRWAEVARHVAMHYNEAWADGQRYGIRYWEVGLGGQAPCDRLAAALQALKGHDPALEVGATLPGLAGAEALLSQLAEQGVRPDFYSWPGEGSGSPAMLARAVAALERLLAAHGLAGAGLVVVQPGAFAAPWAASACGAAHLVATLSLAQDTALARAYYGEAGGAPGLLDRRGGLTAAGQAWHLLAQLDDTPHRLLAQGGDDLGFTILAGRSDDGCLVQILIADTGSRSQGYRLGLVGFRPGYRYTVTEIAEGRTPGVIAEGAGDRLAGNVLALRWRSPAVHLVRIEWP